MPPRAVPDTNRTPTPLPEGCRNSGFRLFFGGSFDPPHLGHVILPQQVRDTMVIPMASLVYVPAARSPHKQVAPTSDVHRVAMLGLSVSSISGAYIWTEELDRAADAVSQPSYWVDTWETVKSFGLEGVHRFLIGTDQALSMHRWHRYRDIWRDAVVMMRDGQGDREAFIEAMNALGVWSPTELNRWLQATVITPTLDVSSTEIRTALADESRRENPIAGLDDRVQRYILDNRLYTPA